MLSVNCTSRSAARRPWSRTWTSFSPFKALSGQSASLPLACHFPSSVVPGRVAAVPCTAGGPARTGPRTGT